MVNKGTKEPHLMGNTGMNGKLFLLVAVEIQVYPWFKFLISPYKVDMSE